MTTPPVTTWGEALMTSLVAALAMFLGAIPKVIGFVLILIIGWIIAAALAGAVAALLRAVKFNDLAERSGFSGFVRNMGAHTDASGMIATVAKVAVWAFAIVIAVNQIGIARELVNTLFMATVGALALALGLAFGLGGRETAAEIVRKWYTKGQQAAPKMAQTAEAAGRQAQ